MELNGQQTQSKEWWTVPDCRWGAKWLSNTKLCTL